MRRVAVSAKLHPLRRKVTSHELLTWSIAEWPSDCSAMDAVNPHRLLVRIVRGDVANVAFDDLAGLLLRLGFMLRRTTGSHHIYVHQEVPQAVNIQEVGGKAKPYQVRQVARLIERYNLMLEDAQ